MGPAQSELQAPGEKAIRAEIDSEPLRATTTTCELADRARQIARSSEGLRRTAAQTAMIALSEAGTLEHARRELEGLTTLEVRRASLAVVDELVQGAASTPVN